MACGRSKRLVARALAIEGKTVARRADVDQAGAAGKEAQRLGRMAAGEVERRVGRLERVFGEGGEQVGEQQFLVLLLVVDAELDQRQRGRRQVGQRGVERLVDMSPPGAHFVERRAAEHAAPGPRVALALPRRNSC